MSPQTTSTKKPNRQHVQGDPKPDESDAATDDAQQRTIPWGQVRQEGTRLSKRWRRQSLPLVAIGGTHALGAVAASLSGPATLTPLAAGWAGAAGGYGYAHRHASRWNRLYAAVAALGSAGWEAAAALAGADGVTAGVLWAGGAALALPWWVRHAEPDPDVTAELAAAPEPTKQVTPIAAQPDAPDLRVVTWGRYIGAKQGALAGSKLSDVTDIPHGWQATVELHIGQHWHSVMQAKKAITSVYGLPDGRVFVEAIPGASVRTARLTILTNDPLHTVVRWHGPSLDPERGTFPLMNTADGQTLDYRFFWPGGGAAHALVSGVNGSGKTKVLDLILTEAGVSDRIVPFVIDGGGGASLPQWTDRVPLAAETPGDARKLLRYALRLMERRRTTIKRQRGGSLEPKPGMPLICVVIDEAHRLLMNDETTGVDNSDIRRMCEILSQEGRKFGIALVLSTQVPSAKQLGGSTVLRDQLKGGTVVGLRVTERTSGNMVSSGAPMPEGLHELPAEFPDGSPTRGLGYVLSARMIRARSRLIEYPEEQPLTDVPLDRDSAAEPAPRMTGADGAREPAAAQSEAVPLHPVADPASTGNAEARVRKAVESGTHADAVSLMRATGLSLGQVRTALAHAAPQEERR